MIDIEPQGMQSEPGTPATDGRIPLCVPKIAGREWEYIKECLDTNWVSSAGSFVDRFEREIAKRIGTRHAVAAVNGTAALHIALLVAGVEADDEVLMPALTFVAPANAVRYVGAWPVFIDVDPQYWQMDPEGTAGFLRSGCSVKNGSLRNVATGRRIKAILPVHLLGHPVDMDPILDLAREFGLVVIEDATESLGALYKRREVGHLGHMACFSFNGNKIITTGGGGMVVTDNGAWAERAKYLTTQAKDNPVEYIHHAVGFNYRLPNTQAAMGVAQLELLDEFVDAKRRTAAVYAEMFADTPGVSVQQEAEWAESTHWLSAIRVDPARFGMDSRRLMSVLATEGIQSRPLWHPLHRLTPYQTCHAHDVVVADRLYQECLCIPSSVGLSSTERTIVGNAVNRASCGDEGVIG